MFADRDMRAQHIMPCRAIPPHPHNTLASTALYHAAQVTYHLFRVC